MRTCEIPVFHVVSDLVASHVHVDILPDTKHSRSGACDSYRIKAYRKLFLPKPDGSTNLTSRLRSPCTCPTIITTRSDRQNPNPTKRNYMLAPVQSSTISTPMDSLFYKYPALLFRHIPFPFFPATSRSFPSQPIITHRSRLREQTLLSSIRISEAVVAFTT